MPLFFLSLSSFFAPFCALHAVFFSFLQSCVCRQRSSFFFFGFVFASSSLVSVCRNFLWFRPHTSVRPLPAEFLKFCMNKKFPSRFRVCGLVFIYFLGFVFWGGWGLLALSSLSSLSFRFWFLGSWDCWWLFWQRCFITILLCAFLSRFIHFDSDLDRKLSSRIIIIY